MTTRRLPSSAFRPAASTLDFTARLWSVTAVAAWLFWLVPLGWVVLRG